MSKLQLVKKKQVKFQGYIKRKDILKTREEEKDKKHIMSKEIFKTLKARRTEEKR